MRLNSVRIVILAPALALRTGLRAMLAPFSAAAQGLSYLDRKGDSWVTDSLANDQPLAESQVLEVVGEEAYLDDLDSVLDGDLLLLTPEAVPGESLPKFLQSYPHPISLLMLAEPATNAVYRSLPGLPLRAWGLLPLDASVEELVAAIRALAEGLVVAPPEFLESLLAHLPFGDDRPADVPVETPTERESEVLQLLAQGLPNKQIAGMLGISEHTVKFHISSLYAKLGATNRTEAVRLGIQFGWVVL